MFFFLFRLQDKIKNKDFLSPSHLQFADYEWKNKLRYVRIYFDTPTFDRIEKDIAAKFVDQLSAIGGTMGLLNGFSIISGVEILYFLTKILYGKIRNVFIVRC